MNLNPGMTLVREYRDADRASWDAFVERCDEATFFHRIGWRDIYQNVFGHRAHYLVAERDGVLVGVLPLVELKSVLFGHALVSLPFAVYGGPAGMDEATNCALTRHAADLANGLQVQHLEMRNRVLREPDWVRQDLYVTFRKVMLPDVEANLLAIPRKQRAMVRKSVERGLKAVVDDDTQRFFDLYADNQHRHGTPPQSKRYFQALKRAFRDDCEVLTVLSAQGQPVSSVLSFYFRDEVLPYYAGDVPMARELAANDFKYWALMQRACERGLRVFDFGRSKRGTGSFDFKRNWGFEPVDLQYEYCLINRDRLPQNNPTNPRYQTAIALWRRLPRRVVNAVGPVLARHLG